MIKLGNKSQTNQKISHFRAERGNERFFEMCFQVLPSTSFFHCLVPAIPLPHASSPAILLFPMPQAHPQAHASSPDIPSSPYSPYSKVIASPYFPLFPLKFPQSDPYFVLFFLILPQFSLFLLISTCLTLFLIMLFHLQICCFIYPYP